MSKFYLTTTLPYVNAPPHMGHALEFVLADILVRYQKDVLGNEVLFNTGTDEHGLKIYRRAKEEGMEPQAYVDKYADLFKKILAREQGLNVQYTHFIRTTDPMHISAAQAFWKRCEQNDDIYLKSYQVSYCVGCELEKSDSELENGKCPLHPNMEIDRIDEENYFFRFSKYQKPLLDLYRTQSDFVLPASRLHEIATFVEMGLEDFSISRLKEKMPWGIPVPGNEQHVMYVWFDALVNYISTLGWPENEKDFNAWWGTAQATNALQIAGKDNLRQQAAMWQAMLMSANLPTSKQILIHGFVNSGGVKMSKSLGNVIDPVEAIGKVGTDALRYFLAREIPTFEDGDFTWERFAQSYNSGLANGLGNLVSRVLRMAISHEIHTDVTKVKGEKIFTEEYQKYHQAFEASNVKHAADTIWEAVASTNTYIEKTEPFKKIKTDPEAAKKDIAHLLERVAAINVLLQPFLPETYEKIDQALRDPALAEVPKLFPRMEASSVESA